jgi:hypothetical protein
MSKVTLFILRFLPSSKEFALGRVRPPGKVRPPTLSSVVSGEIKKLFLLVRFDLVHLSRLLRRAKEGK